MLGPAAQIITQNANTNSNATEEEVQGGDGGGVAESQTRQREEEEQEVEEDGSRQRCGLCGEKDLEGKEGLYRHYAYRHYKSKLTELLGGDRQQCPYCEYRFKYMAEVPGHIGYHHSKVEDFLPQHLHVKESPPAQQDSAGSKSPIIPAGARDLSSCGHCDHKPFTSRSDLYRHYSTVHFSKSLKQFINVKKRTCNLCGNGKVFSELKKLIVHVGSTHDKVEQFLDPSLHVSKRQTISYRKSSDHECYLCHNQFSSQCLLKSHLSRYHFKEELNKFVDEEQLQCKICHSEFTRVSNLLIHVGIVHKKLDEVMPQTTKTSELTGNEQSLDQLDLDLELSSDDEPEDSEISQGDVANIEEEKEEGEDDDEDKEKPKDKVSMKKVISNTKNSDNKCNLCQKTFSVEFNLKSHQAHRHFKEELNKFLDEKQLQCNICYSTFKNVYILRTHVGIIHKKVDEFMKNITKTGNKKSTDQLDMDLSSDEDQGGSDVVTEDGEVGESQYNKEDFFIGNSDEGEEELEEEEEKERHESDSRKRLRVPGKDAADVRVKKSKTVSQVQEDMRSAAFTAVDGGEKLKDSEDEGNYQDKANSTNCLPSDPNKDSNQSEVARSSEKWDEIDELLSDSD